MPVALALFLESNATLLAFAAVCVVAHTAVSLWDTSVAQPRRYISPLEQQVHSFLEMLPLFALALGLILHWDAVMRPTWELSTREPPLPVAWTAGVLLALCAGLAMIVEELVRCLRAAHRRDLLPAFSEREPI